MRASGIGGQAVMEGIMMKNKADYALAVRLPNGEIHVEKDVYPGFLAGKKILSLPFIRGAFNFVDSMVLGMGTLMRSSLLTEGEEEVELTEEERAEREKGDSLYVTITVCISILMAVALFMLLPLWISNFFRKFIESSMIMAVIEGMTRLAIFITYICLISKMKEIQRVFMYHGAEHKCINCIESGLELTVENVRKSSKQHKRCGTSFLLIVVIISTLVFMFVKTDTLWLRMVSRILLLPVITGISYEFLRLAGRSEAKIVDLLSRPGLMLQGLTTKEPEDDMIEVAIASVEAVFDWKGYLKENFPEVEISEEVAHE